MTEEICPQFSVVKDGFSISGLRPGVMKVADFCLSKLTQMSHEGGLYPYRIVKTRWNPDWNERVWNVWIA